MQSIDLPCVHNEVTKLKKNKRENKMLTSITSASELILCQQPRQTQKSISRRTLSFSLTRIHQLSNHALCGYTLQPQLSQQLNSMLNSSSTRCLMFFSFILNLQSGRFTRGKNHTPENMSQSHNKETNLPHPPPFQPSSYSGCNNLKTL